MLCLWQEKEDTVAQIRRLLLAFGFGFLGLGIFIKRQDLFIIGLLGVAMGMVLQAISISKFWYDVTADIVLSVSCLIAVILVLFGNNMESGIVAAFLVIGFM